ncbi:MAG: hypothetical protein R3E66_04385 [bacterium]
MQPYNPASLGSGREGPHPGSTDYRNEQHMVITPAGRAYYTTAGLIQLADTQADWIRIWTTLPASCESFRRPFS